MDRECVYNASMDSKPFVWAGLFVGSTLGGYIPSLWGAGIFSFSGLIFSSVGALLGIWVGFKLANW